MTDPDAPPGTTTYLSLAEPMYTLVNLYGDRSGIVGAYGPFRSEADAKAAISDLERVGIGGQLWEIVPTWRARVEPKVDQ